MWGIAALLAFGMTQRTVDPCRTPEPIVPCGEGSCLARWPALRPRDASREAFDAWIAERKLVIADEDREDYHETLCELAGWSRTEATERIENPAQTVMDSSVDVVDIKDIDLPEQSDMSPHRMAELFVAWLRQTGRAGTEIHDKGLSGLYVEFCASSDLIALPENTVRNAMVVGCPGVAKEQKTLQRKRGGRRVRKFFWTVAEAPALSVERPAARRAA